MKRNRRPARAPSSAAAAPAPRGSWIGLALFALTVALYAPSLGNGLTNWDDPNYVTENPIATLGWAGVVKAFTTPFDGAYYPLTHATYALVHALFGPSPAAHHLLQILLFGLTVMLVPRALSAFGVPEKAGAVAAVVWAVHPLRVESVSWAANLKDTLGAFLVVASFALFAQDRRRWAAVAFAGGLLAKSMFFPLAVLFPVAELLRGEKLVPALKRSWPAALAAAGVAAIAGALHFTGPQAASWAPRSVDQLIGTALWTPWWYLGRLVWPASSSAVYDFALVGATDLRFWAAVALWAVAAALLWRAPAKLRPYALVAVAAYVLALLPVGGLIPVSYPVADRYTLFPSLALFAALAAVLAQWTPPRAVVVTSACAAVLLAPFNVLRQREWKDSVALWEANAKTQPELWTVHYNLSDAYAAESRWDDAIRELEDGLKLRPERRDALGPLFFSYAARDRVAPGDLRSLYSLLQKDGFEASSLLEVSEYCVSRGHLRTARALLERVPRLEANARAHRMLSAIDRREGRMDSATSHARRALELGAQKARIELIYALADAGRADEALPIADWSFEDPFTRALLQGARGYALLKLGREAEGRAEVTAAQQAIAALGSAPVGAQ